MSTPARQLTITIPDGVAAGALLKIPINGGLEKITARVPEGLGPGSTLVLTKYEGSDEWVEEAPDVTPLPESPPIVQDNDETVKFENKEWPKPPSPREDPVRPTRHAKTPTSERVAYTVRLDTTVGVIDIIVRPDWAPHGARRFLDLAANGDLDDIPFYRSVKGCLAQFGLPARRDWPSLPDDPPIGVPFLLGAVCFAAVGENSRKHTLFICLGDMSHCFGQQPWETPIGAVSESSLDVLDRIETIYGDIAECNGAGPHTGRINIEGNAYLRSEFPLLTYICSARPLDWQPPVQESEQTILASQAVQAVQIAQSVHAAETVANVAHAFQAARATQVAAAAELAKAHKTDTKELLKKLEAQEKVHQAALKEMERSIAEAAVSSKKTQVEPQENSRGAVRIEPWALRAEPQENSRGGVREQISATSKVPRLIEVPVETLPAGSLREASSINSRLRVEGSSSRSNLISPRPATYRSLSRSPSHHVGVDPATVTHRSPSRNASFSPSRTVFSDSRCAPILSRSVIYDDSAMRASPYFQPPFRELRDPHSRFDHGQTYRGASAHQFPQGMPMPQVSQPIGLQPLGSQPLSPGPMQSSFHDSSFYGYPPYESSFYGYPPSRPCSPMPNFSNASPNSYAWQPGIQPPSISLPMGPGVQYPPNFQVPPPRPIY